MTLKKFSYILKWNTSVVDLKNYLYGNKKIPLRNKKDLARAREYIIKLIPFREKDNERFCLEFLTSDLCHMAEIMLVKRKIKITKNKLIDMAFNILNTANSQRQTELLRSNENDRVKTIPEVFTDSVYSTGK